MDTCKSCGRPLTWSGRGRPPSKFCSRKCKEDHRSASKHAALLERRAGQRCAFCGGPVPLEAGSRVQTCSKACSVAWQNQRRREAKRSAQRAEGILCVACSQPVPVPDTGRRRTKYCSPECKKRTMDIRWRERSPGYMRQYIYGITPEQYAALLAKQDGRCAICRSADWPGKWKRPNVDHDHAGGAVRGLLCGNCNNGIGMFGDDPARLRAAANYLEHAPRESTGMQAASSP